MHLEKKPQAKKKQLKKVCKFNENGNQKKSRVKK